jgi:hypothetical protein
MRLLTRKRRVDTKKAMESDDLRYADIETRIAQALPEVAPAAARYWEKEGAPGEDCGAYIFFEDMFALYVQILLALPASPRRDELVRRALSFIEQMLSCSDGNVRDLAFIGLFEGREGWLFARCRSFLGPATIAVLDEKWPQWRSHLDERVVTSEWLLDGYGVRQLIADELREEGVTIDGVPGRSFDVAV